MHAQVAGPRRLGTDGIQARQAPIRAVDGECAYRAGARALKRRGLVGGVKVRPGRVEGEPCRVGSVGEGLAQRQVPAHGVHLEQVNALAVTLAALRSLGRTVGAHIGQNGPRRLVLWRAGEGRRRQAGRHGAFQKLAARSTASVVIMHAARVARAAFGAQGTCGAELSARRRASGPSRDAGRSPAAD